MFTHFSALKHEKSKLVACGRSHTIIATGKFSIYFVCVTVCVCACMCMRACICECVGYNTFIYIYYTCILSCPVFYPFHFFLGESVDVFPAIARESRFCVCQKRLFYWQLLAGSNALKRPCVFQRLQHT